MMTDKEAMDMILAHAVPGAPLYVPVMERGPQDTAYSEMLRLLDLSTQQAAEIETLRAALSELVVTRELLRRARDSTPEEVSFLALTELSARINKAWFAARSVLGPNE